MDACADESMYRIDENEGTPGSLPAGKKTPKTLSGSKSHKRKRLRENLAQLASEGEMDTETPMFKRKSSEVPRRSLSISFLDATADTSTPFSGTDIYTFSFLYFLFFLCIFCVFLYLLIYILTSF